VFDCHAGKAYPKEAVYVGCRVARAGKVIREGTIYGNGKCPLKGHYPMAGSNESEFHAYAVKKMQEPAFRGQAIKDLRGKDLLCWCVQEGPKRDEFCHARVWLELVNA
jgi:hypothetical protein